jgi:adenylate cyclase
MLDGLRALYDPRLVRDFRLFSAEHGPENPRTYYIHLWLAGALGFKGDLDEAKAALAESLKLNPEINSFAAQRAQAPYHANPLLWALREKTLNVGLRRIGFPEE